MAGPLEGIRVIEIAGLGPAPFASMMLADHGAQVIRVDRPGTIFTPNDPLLRSRQSVIIDLKSAKGRHQLRQLCKSADGLIEGFRPGVMERLGLGTALLLDDNPKLVIGRMTGWGQKGPYAQAAGHDINYIALSGVLGSCGRRSEKPTVPLNLVGDFGGGAMMLAFAMVSALLAVKNGHPGQVIDCAMTDGSALLTAMIWGFRADGTWNGGRGENLLDSGAPFYDCYETADGGYVAIGAIEPQFFALLRDRLDLNDDPAFDDQNDQTSWPGQRQRLTSVFLTRTRDEWCALLQASDVCFAPVLTMEECVDHPHNRARGTFITVEGVVQPGPAPRYSHTACAYPTAPRPPGADQALIEKMLHQPI